MSIRSPEDMTRSGRKRKIPTKLLDYATPNERSNKQLSLNDHFDPYCNL